jgi:hypothetical protein
VIQYVAYYRLDVIVYDATPFPCQDFYQGTAIAAPLDNCSQHPNRSIAFPHDIPLRHGIAVSRRSKVCLSAKRSKDTTKTTRQQKQLASQAWEHLLPNIVRRIDTMNESRVPTLKNALHNLDTSKIDVLDRGRESSLLRRLEQVHTGRLARVRTVEVGRRAHDDDAAKVDELGGGGADEHLESRVVFLCSGIVSNQSIYQLYKGLATCAVVQ